jgi:hypothetical protein
MNKKFLLGSLAVFAVIALASAVSGASGEIAIVPAELNACCGNMQYTVTATNNLDAQTQFDISVVSDKKLDIMLEPRQISIPAKSSQELIMLVKVPCGVLPGDYKITVSAVSKTVCKNTCGDVCTDEAGSDEAVLTVGEDCVAPEEPEPVVTEPEPVDSGEKENLTSVDSGKNDTTGSPTGAVVSQVDNSLTIGALLVLFGVFLVLLAIIQRNSDKNKSDKNKSQKTDN